MQRIDEPEPPRDPEKVIESTKLDRENAFMLYATFCGDVVRTAAALNIAPSAVIRIAEEDNWNAKLAPIIELQKSATPGDIERAVNRALNFVQAHKMRLFLQRVVARVTGMTDSEVEEYVMAGHGKDGFVFKQLSTRALADLASALEKCHALTYMALSDTAAERVKRGEKPGTASANDMHTQIAEAMARARANSSPKALLFDAQISAAQDLANDIRKIAE